MSIIQKLAFITLMVGIVLTAGCAPDSTDKKDIAKIVQQKEAERGASVDQVYEALKARQKEKAAELKEAMDESIHAAGDGTLESKIDFIVGTPVRLALRAWFAFRDNALMFGMVGLLPFEIGCLIGYRASTNDSKIRYGFFFIGLFAFVGFFSFLLLPGILLQKSLG